MTFTPAELKRRAIDFSREHADDHDEKSQSQTFWRDFFGIFGLSTARIGVFEARALTIRGTVGFIDFFWPKTLLVEQKSKGRDLDEALTQALNYCITGGISDSEMPRYILVSDFATFRVMDLEHLGSGEKQLEFPDLRLDLAKETPTYVEFPLSSLHLNIHRFNFILGYEQRVYRDEDPVNIRAAELMGALHDALRQNGYDGHPLEVFLVRLMFCFFADDTGIFQKDQFADYIEARTRSDGSDTGSVIDEVFRILDLPIEKRQKTLSDDLAAFPYVNGQLFQERLDIPYFNKDLREKLLEGCGFNWSMVSPAIFGSLFQSVMKPTERRSLGAHYTSEKNILKTIHGLFLDEMESEFTRIKVRRQEQSRLFRELLGRIAEVRFLDPACGCGNFLILAYRELRRLEIRIHKELRMIVGEKGLELDVGWEARGITVDHIYGIEYEEFPSQIARVALWIMDHLMNVELSTALGGYRPSIPLTASPNIICGNALRIDWKTIVSPNKLTYILGNPPFVGKTYQNSEQREDMSSVFGGITKAGDLDYVACWHLRAAQYINEDKNNQIRVGFVSTNSITQGEQVPALWPLLLDSYSVKIHFAHKTFKWTNEASGKAAVHVVIIGFSNFDIAEKQLFDYPSVTSEPTLSKVKNISPYLIPLRDLVVRKEQRPLSPVTEMRSGSKPSDGGNLIMTPDERLEYLTVEPLGEKFIRTYIGSTEFINGTVRYCFWLKDANPSELKTLPNLQRRISAVRKFRQESTAEPTNRMADFPTLFFYDGHPSSEYLVIPEVSSERRKYIPIAYLGTDTIASNKCYLVADSDKFVFGCLSSTMHMAWMRVVSGRLKSDYQYSGTMVYNTFPFPMIKRDSTQRASVAKISEELLQIRRNYADSTLADLYDPNTMPPELTKIHQVLDQAVDKCYRKEPFLNELDRVAFLFDLYEKYKGELFASPQKRKRGS